MSFVHRFIGIVHTVCNASELVEMLRLARANLVCVCVCVCVRARALTASVTSHPYARISGLLPPTGSPDHHLSF